VHADTEGASVYVVDDDLDNCECIAMALDKLGLQTHYASKPELGVEHLRTNSSDLVVLDVDLGTMNGFDRAFQTAPIAPSSHHAGVVCQRTQQRTNTGGSDGQPAGRLSSEAL
jgi:PleD family two-component response regulator